MPKYAILAYFWGNIGLLMGILLLILKYQYKHFVGFAVKYKVIKFK